MELFRRDCAQGESKELTRRVCCGLATLVGAELVPAAAKAAVRSAAPVLGTAKPVPFQNCILPEPVRENESSIANPALRSVRTRLDRVPSDPLQKGFSKNPASIMIGSLAGASWNLKSARAVLFT